MRLLDTDTLGHLFQGHPQVIKRLAQIVDDVCTSVVSRYEILRARAAYLLKAADAEHLLRAQLWLRQSESLLAQFNTIEIDHRAAAEFDGLRALRRLRKIGRADLLIASIARAHAAVLVTRNTRDFALVPNLQTENWLD